MASLAPAGRTPGQVSPRPRARRGLRVAGWVLAALALAYGAAQAAARHACRDGALRSRIAALFAARIGPVELGPDVRVDALFGVRFGPLTVPGALRGDAPLVRIESIAVSPDLLRLVRTGKVAAAGVTLEGVGIEVPRSAEAFAALARRVPRRSAPATAAASGGGAEAAPVVRVRDLSIAFTLRDKRARALVPRAVLRPQVAPDGSLTASATLELPGGGHAVADLRREGEGWRAVARLDGLDRAALPDGLAAQTWSRAWSGGTVAARLDGVYLPARRQARALFQVSASGLLVGDDRGGVVGDEPIGPLDLAAQGELAWDGAARRLTLAGGRLSLPGGAPVAVEAELGLREGLPLSARVRADAIDFASLAAALPPALALPDGAPRPAGSFDAHLAITGPLADPAAWQLDAGLDLARMRKEARRAPPVPLLGAFVHHAELEGGAARAILVGAANPDFVPVSELPAYVIRAVTTCEDAGFFGHQGFDFAELRNAAVEGAQAGRVVRGGSTISQQLAKNLYLTREKTLSRKLREALLTIALEATVPKQRLLEIYLNVAEWGPGVFGIGPAAHHWFGKDARALSPREAAFLATVIPNPVRYHYMWSRGFLSDHWEERVDGLLRTMAAQGVLTDEQLASALAQPLTFARCASGPDRMATGATCRGT